MVFQTWYKHLEYQIMFFGLTNTLATCQELFNQVFRIAWDDFAIVYFDNILVYSNDKKNISNMSNTFSKDYKNMICKQN